jgi:nicotinate phosphoribosyltransferase
MLTRRFFIIMTDQTTPFLDTGRVDQYFLNTQRVLEGEGRDPWVVMEVFPNADGLLCGIVEVLSFLREVLPDDAEVWALEEGAIMARKEVVLRIRAAYRVFGLYETTLLGTLAHGSGWATAARLCLDAAGEVPVISFGARHVHPAVSDRMEYAALIAGCATPAGGALAGQEATGTMPHALMLIYGDTISAAQAFDAHMPDSVQRIVLVDTFRDEAEESVRLAQAMAGRLWGVRLDTPSELGGVTPELVGRVRKALDDAGFDSVGIFVSGGLTPERISEFVRLACPIAGFGVGSAISGASPIDFTADLKEVDGRPVGKRGRKVGVQENTRLQQVQ